MLPYIALLSIALLIILAIASSFRQVKPNESGTLSDVNTSLAKHVEDQLSQVAKRWGIALSSVNVELVREHG